MHTIGTVEKFTYILTLAAIILTSCNTNTLDPKTAADLIKKESPYPQVLDYDIFCSDPEHARKVLKAGLEEQGFVLVQRTQKLKDVGKPLISFTEAAKPYLLPVSEKEINIQKVKIADEEFSEIRDINIGDSGNYAVVNYTTVYKNSTPMASLLDKALPTKNQREVYFSLTYKGWEIVKKADIELLELMK